MANDELLTQREEQENLERSEAEYEYWMNRRTCILCNQPWGHTLCEPDDLMKNINDTIFNPFLNKLKVEKPF